MEKFPWIVILCSHSCCYDNCLLGCDVTFTNVSKELPSSKYKKKTCGRKRCRITRLQGVTSQTIVTFAWIICLRGDTKVIGNFRENVPSWWRNRVSLVRQENTTTLGSLGKLLYILELLCISIRHETTPGNRTSGLRPGRGLPETSTVVFETLITVNKNRYVRR